MADSELHPHHRAALVAGGIAMLGVGALVLAAYQPVAAIVLGAAAGCLALYAGHHWLRRKLGIRSSGRRWRLPRPRTARGTSGGKRAGLGSRTGPRPNRGTASPQGRTKRLAGRRAASGASSAAPATRRKPFPLHRPGRAGGTRPGTGSPARVRKTAAGVRRILAGPLKGRRPRGRRTHVRPLSGAGKPRPSRLGKTASNAAILPAALLYGGARWMWHKTRRTKPAARQLPVATKPPAVRRQQPAKTTRATVPAGTPKGSAQSAKPRMFDYTKGPNIMNHLDAASEAVLTHIGRFEPENAADLDKFLANLPEFFSSVASSFRQVAAKLSDGYPVDASIPDRLNDIGSTIAGMGDYSGEAHAAHRAHHEKELERIEQPRTNEKFWDVSSQ